MNTKRTQLITHAELAVVHVGAGQLLPTLTVISVRVHTDPHLVTNTLLLTDPQPRQIVLTVY